MKSDAVRPGLLLLGLASLLALSPATAQQPDYLTAEEVEAVREAQEPNQRIQLFLKFTQLRWSTFDQKLAAPSGPDRRSTDALQDALNDYIRAVDDTAGTLQDALDRGGVDLRTTRKPLEEAGRALLSRLEEVQDHERIVGDEFRWDMQDAVEATRDLIDTAAKIPDEPIPAKFPEAAGEGEEKKEEAPPPGKPTLKKKRAENPQP